MSWSTPVFAFGLDHDSPDVFDRTVEWAVEQGIATATFHIMTPYPFAGLWKQMEAEDRIVHGTGISTTPAMSSTVRRG
ncbi:hypothetical protein [Streptomyces sp. NPDC005148]